MQKSFIILSFILLVSSISVDETKQVVDGILGTDFSTTVGQNIPKCIDEWAQAADDLANAIYDFTDGDWPEGIALIGELLEIVPDIKKDCFDQENYTHELITAFQDPAAFQAKEVQCMKQIEVFTELSAAAYFQEDFTKCGKFIGYTIDTINNTPIA